MPRGEHKQGAAASSVLNSVLHHDHFDFTVTSEVLPGTTRSFRSFSDAVEEATLSRIFAGVHFRFTASELFSGFLAPDTLQDTTAIQRRRFVAAHRRAGKDYWQVERHPKIIAAPALFRKAWNKNTPPRLYVDECNRS